jgi:hypothetical protein
MIASRARRSTRSTLDALDVLARIEPHTRRARRVLDARRRALDPR